MTTILGLSAEIWAGVVLGAILGAIVIPMSLQGAKWLAKWYRESRPRVKVLGTLADDREVCTIFVRDFYLEEGSRIVSFEPRRGIGVVPNVVELWPDVEGRGVSYVLNALGQVGKRRTFPLFA